MGHVLCISNCNFTSWLGSGSWKPSYDVHLGSELSTLSSRMAWSITYSTPRNQNETEKSTDKSQRAMSCIIHNLIPSLQIQTLDSTLLQRASQRSILSYE